MDPPIPAATVVILRDTDDEVEVLMLHKNSKIAFGGMWVFPGGRIDEEDYPEDGDIYAAALNAAERETLEESGVEAAAGDFVWFAHWTPPPSTPKRFATWFFATRIDKHQDINIDGGEILDHKWIKPSEALEKHKAGEIDLAPPTWITLYHLSLYSPSAAILEQFRANREKVYQTRVVKNAAGERVALWHGDAGYDDWNADTEGERHRLILAETGFVFENTVEQY